MRRSARAHLIYAHQYGGASLITERLSRSGPVVPFSCPFIGQRPHIDPLASWEETHQRILYASINEARKLSGLFKVEDNDYSVVESFLTRAFKRKQSLSASEIADRLNMDYGDVREVLARMIKEGKLGVK